MAGKTSRERYREYRAAGWSTQASKLWARIGDFDEGEKWRRETTLTAEQIWEWIQIAPQRMESNGQFYLYGNGFRADDRLVYLLWQRELPGLSFDEIRMAAIAVSKLWRKPMSKFYKDVLVAHHKYNIQLWNGLEHTALKSWDQELLPKENRYPVSVALIGEFCGSQRIASPRLLIDEIFAYIDLGVDSVQELAKWSVTAIPEADVSVSTICMNPELLRVILAEGFTSDSWANWVRYGIVRRFAVEERPSFIAHDFISVNNLRTILPSIKESMREGISAELAIERLGKVELPKMR